MDLNERIIECVRKHNYLWEPRNRHYKNAVLKARLWKEIGEELNENSETIKKKWKSLRDRYMKYKKQIKGTTGSGRKIIHFIWSAQLSFLGNSITPRETVSNVSGDSRTQITDSDTSASSPSTPATSSTATNPEYITPLLTSETSPTESTDLDISIQPISTPSARPLETTETRRAKKRIAEADVDSMIVDFFNKKKEKPRHDSIDYLFLSYAQTFKKLSKRKQAMLKVDLARLFSEAELSEIASPREIDSPQYVQHLSPAYSIISTTADSGSVTYNTDNTTHEIASPQYVQHLSPAYSMISTTADRAIYTDNARNRPDTARNVATYDISENVTNAYSDNASNTLFSINTTQNNMAQDLSYAMLAREELGSMNDFQ